MDGQLICRHLNLNWIDSTRRHVPAVNTNGLPSNDYGQLLSEVINPTWFAAQVYLHKTKQNIISMHAGSPFNNDHFKHARHSGLFLFAFGCFVRIFKLGVHSTSYSLLKWLGNWSQSRGAYPTRYDVSLPIVVLGFASLFVHATIPVYDSQPYTETILVSETHTKHNYKCFMHKYTHINMPQLHQFVSQCCLLHKSIGVCNITYSHEINVVCCVGNVQIQIEI